MAVQLPLGVMLRDDASFENYLALQNSELVSILKALGSSTKADAEKSIYLWGRNGTGKSHLLQAVCHRLSKHGLRSTYLPLSTGDDLSPAILEGLEYLAAVCIDDIDTIAKSNEWETALFHFYNRIKETGNVLITAATCAPTALPLALPDLCSRLSAGLVWQLTGLNDEEKIAALQMRAKQRGLELNDDVGRFLIRHCPRDMTTLFTLLDRLDSASLAAQRRLTIPFVKEVINE